MKATVFEIKRFAVHDGDGIRTTVFLKGCPLKCLWCHNPEGLYTPKILAYYEHKCILCGECASVCQRGAHRIEEVKHIFDREKCIGCGECESACFADALKLYGKEMSAEELIPILSEDKEFYENSGGGVTVSGGECLLYPDFVAELLSGLKAIGINTAVDTSGAVPREAIDKVLPYTDTFLYDIKAVSSEVHKRCTGRSNAMVIDNLKYISSLGKRIEIRYPFVPGFNDGEAEDIAKLISELETVVGIRVLPYHNYAGSKYAALGMENTLPENTPTKESLDGAKNIFRSYGIKVID